MLGRFDERLAHVLQKAKGYNSLTFIDPVIPYEHGWEFLSHALKWTDVFHCNEVEAFNMTGEKDPRKAAKALIKEGVKFVIISMGERGLIAKTEKVALEMPALKVPVIDPSGAGDAFCAGMIYKLVQKTRYEPRDIVDLPAEDLVNILLEGATAGAACATAIGTTTAVTRENVDRLLKEQGQEILKNVLITTEQRA
jgi:sugar/nucleoside kinase (ribokinase family)